MKFQVICWDIYYLSERLRCRLSKSIQNFNKFDFDKNFSGALVYTVGAAGIWAMHFFGSAYFDEIIIFGLGKDQIFRI
jgi:hypothetical protein